VPIDSNSSINCGGSKDPDENTLATNAALIECFRTVSSPALITGLTINCADIRYSTHERLKNIGTLRSLKRGSQSDEPCPLFGTKRTSCGLITCEQGPLNYEAFRSGSAVMMNRGREGQRQREYQPSVPAVPAWVFSRRALVCRKPLLVFWNFLEIADRLCSS
jgi:hypothetical protein